MVVNVIMGTKMKARLPMGYGKGSKPFVSQIFLLCVCVCSSLPCWVFCTKMLLSILESEKGVRFLGVRLRGFAVKIFFFIYFFLKILL